MDLMAGKKTQVAERQTRSSAAAAKLTEKSSKTTGNKKTPEARSSRRKTKVPVVVDRQDGSESDKESIGSESTGPAIVAEKASDGSAVDPKVAETSGSGLNKFLDGVSRSRSESTSSVDYKAALRLVKDYSINSDVSEWISLFTEVTGKWTEALKFQLFRERMVSSGHYTWFRSLNFMGGRSVEEWLLALRQKFTKDPQALRHEVQSRKQTEGENPMVFVRDVSDRCLRYNPDMPEIEIVSFISENVHQKYKRDFRIINAHAKTVQVTESSLRQAMQIADENPEKAEAAKTYEGSIFVSEVKEMVPSTSRRIVCDYCHKTGHVENDCFRNPKGRNFGGPGRTGKQAKGAFDPKSRKREAGRSFGGKCFRCEQTGHRAAECSVKIPKVEKDEKKDESSGNGQ